MDYFRETEHLENGAAIHVIKISPDGRSAWWVHCVKGQVNKATGEMYNCTDCGGVDN